MIGHHDQRLVWIEALERLPDNLVSLYVEPFDHGAERRVADRVVRGMTGVHGVPHHMRHLVEESEIIEEQPSVEAVKKKLVLGSLLVSRQLRLLQKRSLVQYSRDESLRILGHPLRVVAPRGLGQLDRELRRRGNRHRGCEWVDVDGRHVQLELRIYLLQVETNDSAERLKPGYGLELDPHPFAPFPLG